MIQAVDYEEFRALLIRVEQLERDNAELRSKQIVQEWLSRAQAMELLSVSEATLWRMTKSNLLPFRYQGKRPFYEVAGIKKYLSGQKINPQLIEKRLSEACRAIV